MARTGPLRTRTIWTLAGAAWGLLVGLVTAVQTAAFLAGVGWLFIFGDDPWPEAANWVLLGMTLVAGVVPFVLLAWLGRRLGIAFESESRQRLRTRRRGWFVFALGAAGIALGVALAGAGTLTERARRADREAANRQYAQLVQTTHRLTDARVAGAAGAAGGPLEIAVAVAGERTGEYVLDWRLRDAVYDSVLASGSRILDLVPGEARIGVTIDTAAVRTVYRRSVLAGEGAVLVDEGFPMRLTLRPILTAPEARRLPDDEVENLERGESDLVSSTDLSLPLRFDVR